MASNHENMAALQAAIERHKKKKDSLQVEYMLHWVQNGQPREERKSNKYDAILGYHMLLSFAEMWPDRQIHSARLTEVVYTEEDITPAK